VITSAFHMPRTKAIFDCVFALDSPSPAYHLDYVEASDDGLDGEMLASRVAREAKSLIAWQTRSFRSLFELHTWLFSEHSCFAPHVCGRAGESAAATALYIQK
jgi:hypothetical protein